MKLRSALQQIEYKWEYTIVDLYIVDCQEKNVMSNLDFNCCSLHICVLAVVLLLLFLITNL